MDEKAVAAGVAATVKESDDSCCVALPVTYASSPRTLRRVAVSHVTIALLALLLFVCALLGHVLPLYQTAYGMQRWYLWARAWENGQELPLLLLRADARVLRCAAAATLPLGLVAFLMTSALVSAWSRAESARMHAEAAHRRLWGRLDAQPACTGNGETAHRSLVSPRGSVCACALETREGLRCVALHRLATAAALAMLCATTTAVISVVVMLRDYRAVVRDEAATARPASGFLCLVGATLGGVIGSVVLLQPSRTHVYPLRRRPAVTRCSFARVAEATVEVVAVMGDGADVRAAVGREAGVQLCDNSAVAAAAEASLWGLDKVTHRCRRRQD